MHGNRVALHPELCDDFIYILSFRYPIERILSFIEMYTSMNPELFNKLKIFPKRLKNDTGNVEWVNRWSLRENKEIFYRYLIKHEFDNRWKRGDRVSKRRIEAYMNNAVTRWIGYEWTKTSKKTGFNGIFAPIKEFSDIKNDIYFYNAIEYLLKVDYVLPFASLQSDDKINSNRIWNKLLKDICKHFGLDQDKYFKSWEHEGNRTQNRKNLMTYLSINDTEALEKYNYFDFKLYELAKYISEADLKLNL